MTSGQMVQRWEEWRWHLKFFSVCLGSWATVMLKIRKKCPNGGGGGLVAKWCPTPVTLWTVARQVPPSMGFSSQEYWRRLPFLSPGDLSDLGIEARSPALQADDLPTELWGKPPNGGGGFKRKQMHHPFLPSLIHFSHHLQLTFLKHCFCYIFLLLNDL